MRRLRVPTDLVRQSIHYLEQYHTMMIVWCVKTTEQMPPGIEREKFRQGMQALMNEIESNFCKLREIAGDNPQTIEEALSQLRNEDYKKLMDKAKIQHYANVVKSVGRWQTWKAMPFKVFDSCLAWVIRSILFVGAKAKGIPDAK